MHVEWPRIDNTVPVRYEPSSPYDDEDIDSHGLDWNTREDWIRGVPVLGAYVTDRAEIGVASYWPNVPPVLPPAGYYWYDLGPIGRGMKLWKTYPEGYRPTPEEQRAELEAHRKKFSWWGRVPEGLPEALAEHGLGLDDSGLVKRAKGVAIGMVASAAIIWIAYKLFGKD